MPLVEFQKSRVDLFSVLPLTSSASLFLDLGLCELLFKNQLLSEDRIQKYRMAYE